MTKSFWVLQVEIDGEKKYLDRDYIPVKCINERSKRYCSKEYAERIREIIIERDDFANCSLRVVEQPMLYVFQLAF
jgi:hypothetical protein